MRWWGLHNRTRLFPSRETFQVVFKVDSAKEDDLVSRPICVGGDYTIEPFCFHPEKRFTLYLKLILQKIMTLDFLPSLKNSYENGLFEQNLAQNVFTRVWSNKKLI